MPQPARPISIPDPKPAPRLHRRVFHVLTTAALALMALALDREVMIAITGTITGLTIALEMARRRFPRLNEWFLARFSVLMKQSESSQVLGSTYMAAASLIVFFFFDKELAILALLYIAVGDPLAGVVGKRYGRVKIGSKSVEGTLAFAVGAGAVGCGMVAGGLDVPYWVALGGAGVGALVELLPSPLDDNLTVPPVSATLMWALLLLPN